MNLGNSGKTSVSNASVCVWRRAAIVIMAVASLSSSYSQPVLTGRVCDFQGRAVRNAEVCLYRMDYRTSNAASKRSFPKGAIRCRTTDRQGRYEMILPGRAAALLIARGGGLWTMGVVAPFGDMTDTVTRLDTLRKGGSLVFRVKTEDGSSGNAAAALLGTPFSFDSDDSGFIHVNGVPGGAYCAVVTPLFPGYAALTCTLRVRSGFDDHFAEALILSREKTAYASRSAPLPDIGKAAMSTAPASPQLSQPRVAALPPPPVPAPKASMAAPLPSVFTKASSAPVVRAPADTFIGIFDSLTLVASATDDGSVASIEWDVGGTGRFIHCADGAVHIPPMRAPVNRMPCVARATDNDGLVSLDTTAVWAGLLWMSVTPPEKLLGRKGHSLVEFNDALYIIGGNRSDVWSSSDGISWTLLTDKAPFGTLFGHTTLVFNGRLWVIGGKDAPDGFSSGIWSSDAGVRWRREAAMPFAKRVYHGAVVFNGRIWVTGGLCDSETDPILDDVWSSADGINWTCVATHASFGGRYGHGCAVFGDKIALIGGFNDGAGADESRGDVWLSSNGSDWRQTASAPPLAKECHHTAFQFDNRLWLVGGYTRDGKTDRFTDVFCTRDCESWVDLTPDVTNATGRFFCVAAPFRGRVFVSPSESHKLWLMR